MKEVLFDYAIVWHPTTQQRENGEQSKIIKKDSVLAKDESTARLKIARIIPEEYVSNLENIDILVKNFYK